ncbi:MAG: DUF1801 domain-containing protein [Rhizobiaceae bacterium]|nr:DUF1801 domain-containing protein [Rhizobiaceae bacterium]
MSNDISPDVDAAFAGFDPQVRDLLMQCRALVFDVGAEVEGVGHINETLKWGQPAYLTDATGAGSTIRLAPEGSGSGTASLRPAMFVHCATDLIEQFKTFYPNAFEYQGKRALIISNDVVSVSAELRHCIALALTYKLRKRAGKMRISAT